MENQENNDVMNNYESEYDYIHAKRPMLKPWEAIGICLKKYAVFKGRARRSEFWWFYLFCILISSGIFMLSRHTNNSWLLILTLLIAIPYYAVLFRRLHDTGRSGWLVLIAFGLSIISVLLNAFGLYLLLVGSKIIDIVSGFLNLGILLMSYFDSDGENEYGPSPKYPNM